jgi:hypothetical protein
MMHDVEFIQASMATSMWFKKELRGYHDQEDQCDHELVGSVISTTSVVIPSLLMNSSDAI